MTNTRIVCLALWSITGFGVAMAAPESAMTSPNFVVILSDDQSWVGTSYLVDPTDPLPDVLDGGSIKQVIFNQSVGNSSI